MSYHSTADLTFLSYYKFTTGYFGAMLSTLINFHSIPRGLSIHTPSPTRTVLNITHNEYRQFCIPTFASIFFTVPRGVGDLRAVNVYMCLCSVLLSEVIDTANGSINVIEAATGAVVIGRLVLIIVIVKSAFVNHLQHGITCILFGYCMKATFVLRYLML